MGEPFIYPIVCSIGIYPVALVVYPLGYQIVMLIWLELANYFGTLGGSLVGVSLVALGGLMIGTWVGPLVGAYLVPFIGLKLFTNLENLLGYLIGYKNPGAILGSLVRYLDGTILANIPGYLPVSSVGILDFYEL